MTISAPDDVSRLALLLADIRDAFAKESEAASSHLVKELVAIDGRPWAEMGKSGKPFTQNRLARMLKPLGIGPGFIGPKDARLRGYKISQFEEAFSRYLPPEGVSKRASVQNAANTGNAGEPGLSNRRIRELADLRSEQAYWKFSPADIASGKLDAWLRDILRKEAPERIELEFQRVLKAR